MPRLSIVIPFLGNPALLETSLVSVLENRPDDCEIVVVRSAVYDDPYGLEDEVCYLEAPGAGPATSFNLGVEASRGQIVHLLACGVEVSPGWTDAVLSHFDDPRVAAVAPMVLTAEPSPCVAAAGIAYHRSGTSRVLGQGAPADSVVGGRAVLGPDASAGFYRKSTLEVIGGLAVGLGVASANLDLALQIQALGLETVLEPASRVIRHPEANRAAGSFRQALEAERLFWRWAASLGWLSSVTMHAMVLVGECCCSLPRPAAFLRVAGRLVGWATAGSARRGGLRPAAPSESPNSPSPVARPHFLDGPPAESDCCLDACLQPMRQGR